MKLLVENLSKTYEDGFTALRNINLEIGTGIYGLLGPNGAGKSSLMKILATLSEPTTGNISFNNTDLVRDKTEVRSLLGYLPQDFGFYPSVTAEMLLTHLAVLKGLKNSRSITERVKYVLDQTNLFTSRKKSLGTYSGGMKQRFGIAQALLNNPKLLILDEPTTGLDPGERSRFYNLLGSLSEQAVIILSTHHVSDVAELCSTIAIIASGELIVKGSPTQLMAKIDGKVWRKSVNNQQLEQLKKSCQILSEGFTHGKRIVHVFDENQPSSFEYVQPTLEDVYFDQLRLSHIKHV